MPVQVHPDGDHARSVSFFISASANALHCSALTDTKGTRERVKWGHRN